MQLRTKLVESKDVGIVTVGAGPIGLIEAIQLAEVRDDIRRVIFERNKTYLRTQPLRLDRRIVASPHINKSLDALVEAKIAKPKGKHYLIIPIQQLEKLLQSHLKGKPITVMHKLFVTQAQFQKLLQEHKVVNQLQLEKKLEQELVVGVEQVKEMFPNCKLLLGADGSRSTVRELIFDNNAQVEKTDLQNMIEVKYEVKGEVHPLSAVEFPLSQPLLEGFLCSESVKYNPAKKITTVTLNFIVDKTTFEHPLLKDVNAKNLLAVSPTLPPKLKQAINMWVKARRDKNIVLGSPTINKTTLSIYTSTRYCKKLNNIVALLEGDAACGFAFMNGLNIGIENVNKLVPLIARLWDQINNDDPAALEELVREYAKMTQASYEHGAELVEKANHKIKIQQTLVDVMHVSSIAPVAIVQKVRAAAHEIFYAHKLDHFPDLEAYIKSKNNDKKKDIAIRLLKDLKAAKMNFDLLKSILYQAYVDNEKLEKSKPKKVFDLVSSMNSLFSLSKQPKEFKFDSQVLIPAQLKGQGVSQTLHEIIYKIFQRVCEYEQFDLRRVLDQFQTMPAKAQGIVTDYSTELTKLLR